MHLTPREQDKLLIFTAAEVARRRRGRGLRLNYPEALALITAEVLEGVRDGRSVSELMAFGVTVLGNPPTKPVSQYKIVGQSIPMRIDFGTQKRI